MRTSRQRGPALPRGCIVCNADLECVARECIDYVPLYELTHLREHIHSTTFYQIQIDSVQTGENEVRLDVLADFVRTR
ncbi:TPA: YgjP-like metallopeptidase domain-containing protein [Stenotrophomonas maltophilia]